MEGIEINYVLMVLAVGILGYILYISFGEGLSKKAAERKQSKPAKETAAKATGKAKAKKDKPDSVHYDTYVMSIPEKLFWTLVAAAVLFGVGYFIYRSIFPALLLTPFALKYPGIKAKSLVKKRKDQLRTQFKEMLYSLNSGLAAGKAVETTFREMEKDMRMLYPGKTGYIVNELAIINSKLEMNEPVEEVLKDFATRTGVEEIATFSEILYISKRAGGNIIDVIKNTSRTITEKLEFRMELETMLAQRKMEQKIMAVFPFVIILLLSGMAPDYMDPVFHTVIGNIIMTIVLVVFAIAWWIGSKIVDIEV